MNKRQRHAAILEIVDSNRIPSQKALRERLREQGFDVTQATLSRDIRELRLVKVAGADGQQHYTLPPGAREQSPLLERILPTLYVDVDGTGNLLVIRTLAGGAQPVASAIDREDWTEIVGTVAGDDTVLLILRDARGMAAVRDRLGRLAGVDSEDSGT